MTGTGGGSLITTAEVTAELDFELVVSDDTDMDNLATHMALDGFDADGDYELAAELFHLDSRAAPATVAELLAPRTPEPLRSAA